MPPTPPPVCPPPDIGFPQSGGILCDLNTFYGTGTPGSVLMLCVRSGTATVFCGTATVNVNGTWQITMPFDLSDGSYTATASQSNAACASTGTTVAFTIECACPPPVILSPVDGSINCGLNLMSGTASPGALVNACIYMDTPQGWDMIYCGSTTADGTGYWQVPFPGLDQNALYTVTANQQTAECTSDFASATYTEDCHKCVILTFLEPFIEGAVCPPVTELSGVGPPNAQVRLDIAGPGGSFSVTTTTDEYHAWSATIPAQSIPGEYTVTGTVLTPPCQQTDSSGFEIIECV